MAGLLGHHDELLRLVEDAFPDAAISVQGNLITVDGADAEQVARLFDELVLLLQSGQTSTPPRWPAPSTWSARTCARRRS